MASPTDPLTLYKTHSLRWLAQIVCQIIKQVKWEAEFECDGIPDLAAFTALIAELEALDPVTCAIDTANHRAGDVLEALRSAKVVEIAKKLDGLLDLLAVTADGLAATWDLMEIEANGGQWCTERSVAPGVATGRHFRFPCRTCRRSGCP